MTDETKANLAAQFDTAADSASECMRVCIDHTNREQEAYCLGRREALRWAASLVRKEFAADAVGGDGG